MAGDETIGAELAESAGLKAKRGEWILEGGAIEGDGTGLVVTTEQCLLNPNRNPQLSRAEIEARLAADLGLNRVLWLGEGLINDHTDGHVDNLARFVRAGRMAVPVASGADDPTPRSTPTRRKVARVRARVRRSPLARTDRARRPGRTGELHELRHHHRLVVVPIFGSPHDDAGVAAIAALFPGAKRSADGRRVCSPAAAVSTAPASNAAI